MFCFLKAFYSFSYLNTAVAFAEDCREKETETSGTVQSQEEDNPQRCYGKANQVNVSTRAFVVHNND